jgi:hypothetical protein
MSFFFFFLQTDGWTAASSSVFMPIIMSTMGTLGGKNGRDPTKPCNLVDPCYVLFGSAHVSPSSYALYITAIAVLVQVRYILIDLTSSTQYFFSRFSRVLIFSHIQFLTGIHIHTTFSCCRSFKYVENIFNSQKVYHLY